ncbi:MAG: membrane dipeptidase [Proteobacteria bacterium]|nr:membrane dipeptidase [Pseudomonadota bacterium]
MMVVPNSTVDDSRTGFDDGSRTVSRRTLLRQLVTAAGAGALSNPLGVGANAANTSTPTDTSAKRPALGITLSEDQRAAGEAFVRTHTTVDMHCHPGALFFAGHLAGDPPAAAALEKRAFIKRACADLAAGRVSAGLFSAVSDMRLLGETPTGLGAKREFKQGEAYADYQRQVNVLESIVSRRLAAPGRSTGDIDTAVRKHVPAAVFAIEGGDFIEDRLDRIHEAHREGVRSVTIVHYHVNQIGDIQTAPPLHGGLTPLGKTIIKEMNAAGILIDLAHATFAVAKDAVEVSSKPMMISHTNLLTEAARFPRLVSLEHAKLITDAGGVIGSWPSGFGQSTFADWIDSIQRLVDAVGVDHVGIGTDMDANYRPVFASYRDWSLIPAALFARGLDEASVSAIMGGNFLRIFRASQP